MEAVEKPDMHASAVRIVRMNSFAAITALWKKLDLARIDGCLAPNHRIFVSTSNISGSAGIDCRRQLRDLYAFPAARIAYDFVWGASIPPCLAGFRFGKFRIIRLLYKLGADCLPALFGRGCPVFLRGVSRPAPGF